ncbi:MAG: hypothetical protein ACPGU1_11355 [Myxococcota bacterium]
MTAPRSERFESFLASVRQPPRTREEHESYDVWSLRGLEGDERDEAERILIERLETFDGDRRPVEALAVLGAAGSEGALKALEDSVAKAVATGHHGAALLVIQVLQDRRRVKKSDVIKVAVKSLRDGDFTAQTSAAALLARVSPKRAPDEILKVLATMPLDFVRGRLYDALLTALGLKAGAHDPPGTLARLGVLVAGHTHAARDAALAELTPIVEKVRAGKTGKSAGISKGSGKRAVGAVIDRLKRGEAPARAEIDSLTDDGKAYVAAWCKAGVPSQVAAHYQTLEALGDTSALPIVDDALTWDDDMLHGARPHLERLRGALSS